MKTIIRRPITRLEARTLLPDGCVLLPHGPAGMFVVWCNPGSSHTSEGLVKTLKANAEMCGFDLEILSAGAGMGSPCLVQIRLTLVIGQQVSAEAEITEALNTEVKRQDGRVVRHPVNLGFAPKPKRLTTLYHFVDAGFAFVEPSEKLSAAFIKRLFVEGMLERNPENTGQFRPTPGGRVWFRRHFAQMAG